MITFEVNDMTCGHCASTITRAIREVDSRATVRIDLAMHLVEIESPPTVDVEAMRAAVTEAGYTPVLR
jgi:copper chaperone